ncbi:MAG: FlgO family outer membrane protein [Elusimicrobiales bacterium]|nr:FlgO family outer membrane protein [Elusimicrobiales bacterium]
MKIISILFLFFGVVYSEDNGKLAKIADDLSINISSKCSNLIISRFDYINNKKSLGPAILEERFITYFGKKNVKLIERAKLDKIFKEYKIQYTGAIDSTTISELGKIAGADCILVGTINDKSDSLAEINARIVKVSDGSIIATSVSEILKDWSDDKNKEGVVESVSFEPSLADYRIEIEDVRPVPKINFTDADIDLIEEYDKISDMDPDMSLSPSEKSKLWADFSEKYAKYSDIAKERADYWLDYERRVKESERLKQEREKALDTDWGKLKRLLNLKSVSADKKTEWVFKFLDAYGWSQKENKYYNEIKRFMPVPCVSGNMGICHYDGSILLEGNYLRTFPFSEGIARIQRLDKKYFYVDRTGRNISRFKQGMYEYVRFFYDGKDYTDGIAVIKGNSDSNFYSLLDKNGNIAVEYIFYDYVSFFSEGLAPVEEKGRHGFIDKNGNLIVAPKYEQVYWFEKGVAKVNLNGKWGFVDKKGKEIIKPIYDEVGYFNNNLVDVKMGGKYGVLDKNGREIIPTKYDEISFYDNLIILIDKNKKGAVSLNGKEIVPLIYDDVFFIDDNFLQVQLKDKYGVFDVKGKEIVPVKYSSVDFGENIFTVGLNGKYGFVDTSGNFIIPLRLDGAGVFKEGLAYVKIRDKFGFVNKEGKEVIPLLYFSAGVFWEGLAAACNSLCGYIDNKGNTAIGFNYDEVYNFSDGAAEVKKGLKWGVIDKTGKEIIPIKYDKIERRYDKFFTVSLKNKKALFDLVGNQITPFKYDEIGYFHKEFADVKIGKKKGVINLKGKEILPTIYDDIVFYYDEGMIKLKSENKIIFSDLEGNIVSSKKYDEAYFSEGLFAVKLGDKWGYLDKFGREYFPSN